MKTNAKGDGNRPVFQICSPVPSKMGEWRGCGGVGRAGASTTENKHSEGTLRGDSVKHGKDWSAEKMHSLWLLRDARTDPKEKRLVDRRKSVASLDHP